MKVSIICPTNRPYNIPRVTEMYHRQDYMDIELIVVQDGNTIGEKRNIACSEAKEILSCILTMTIFIRTIMFQNV